MWCAGSLLLRHHGRLCVMRMRAGVGRISRITFKRCWPSVVLFSPFLYFQTTTFLKRFVKKKATTTPNKLLHELH